MQDPIATPTDSITRALGLERSIDDAWSWATAPIVEAGLVGRDLVLLAERRDLPLGGLRALTQLALGEPARPAVVDRWLEHDAEVVGALGRVGAVSRQLEGLPARARVAVRAVMALALAAPQLARLAAAEVWRRGPRPERDTLLRTLEGLPLAAKQRAEEVRAEATMAESLALRAKEAILAGLRLRARPGALIRTARLTAVG